MLGELYLSFLNPGLCAILVCVLMTFRVQEVTPDKVILSIKNPKDKDAKPEMVEIASGFVLWSTGIGK
jgi:hypothetical protein